jgi:hypothetical protein
MLTRGVLAVPVVALALLASCNGPTLPGAPTVPSQPASTAGSSGGGATVDTMPTVGGAVTALSGTCPVLSFVLSGTTVHLSATTRIEGGTCADIKEGIRAGATGTKRPDGSIDAVQVRIAPPPPPSVGGMVASLTGTCPALSFVLSGTTVHLSATTRFEGGTCADIKEGVRAGATGTKRPDGSIDAVQVRIAPPPPPSVGGMVASLTGTCPALSFVLSGTTVHLSATTRFEGGTCADIKEGVRAGATGTKRPDGSIDAVQVRIAPPPPPSVGGMVASLTGTCPALSFVLSGTTVHLSATTRFEGGTCADIKEGVRAGATGTKRPDGSIDAVQVRIAPPPPPSVGGMVSSLTGTCPALSFVLSGTTVHLSATTRFEGGTCADIKEGVRAGATGTKRPDGSIDAAHVRMATPL